MEKLSQTLKLYGLSLEQINQKLEKLELKGRVKTYVKEKYLDAFLFIEAKNEQDYYPAVKEIVTEFTDYIYAERDISLYERLYEVLKIRNKTIALMEEATGGIIASNLLAFDGSENIVKLSYILPSTEAMIAHFDLNPFKFTVNHGVCNEIAFDIASHIRNRTKADLYVVCLSTLAKGNHMYYNGNTASYIAIGSTSGVKLYKVEGVQGEKKRDFMNKVAKTVCFKLINLLK